MGQTRVYVRVHRPPGSVDVEVRAETGATVTKLPRSAIEQIGAEATYKTTLELVI